MPATSLPLLRMVLYAHDEASELGLQDVAAQLAIVANSIYQKLPAREIQHKEIAESMRLVNDSLKKYRK